MDGPAPAFASNTALFVFGGDLRIVCWNDGAERLTGIPTRDAVGRPCWEVIAGHDDGGNLVCHRGCSRARLVREGRCVSAAAIHTRTAAGYRRLWFETITAATEAGPLFLHVLRDAPAAPDAAPAPCGTAPRLTPRQQQILGLLAEGQPVKAVATTLGLRETTVRNHVRQLLLALDAHSQLEAVAKARGHGLV